MDVGGMLKHYRTAQGALSAPARLVAAMRVMALALMLALAGTVLPGGVQSARADTADINAAARSVVRVVIVMRDSSGYDVIGHGTGFAVTPKLIVTNAHVLAPLLEDDRLRLGIVPAQGRTGYFARIVRVAGDVDLALVELTEDASLPVSTLYSGRVEDGQDVYAVGYPANVDQALGLGEDAEIHRERGHALVGLQRLPEAVRSYRNAARLAPGDISSRYNMAEVLLVLGESDLAQSRNQEGLARWREAERALREVLGLSPGHARARNRLERLRERLP